MMQYPRPGNWILISKLPVPIGDVAIVRIADNGWIERRGTDPRYEIKLTPAGLVRRPCDLSKYKGGFRAPWNDPARGALGFAHDRQYEPLCRS